MTKHRTKKEMLDLIQAAALVAGVEPSIYFEEGDEVHIFWTGHGSETWTMSLMRLWLRRRDIDDANILSVLSDKFVTNPFLRAVNKALCA